MKDHNELMHELAKMVTSVAYTGDSRMPRPRDYKRIIGQRNLTLFTLNDKTEFDELIDEGYLELMVLKPSHYVTLRLTDSGVSYVNEINQALDDMENL